MILLQKEFIILGFLCQDIFDVQDYGLVALMQKIHYMMKKAAIPCLIKCKIEKAPRFHFKMFVFLMTFVNSKIAGEVVR